MKASPGGGIDGRRVDVIQGQYPPMSPGYRDLDLRGISIGKWGE